MHTSSHGIVDEVKRTILCSGHGVQSETNSKLEFHVVKSHPKNLPAHARLTPCKAHEIHSRVL